MIIPGLHDLATHLITIFLIWLAVVLINGLVKKNILKSIQYRLKVKLLSEEELEGKKVKIEFISLIVNRIAGTIALVFGIISLLFLYNPMERSYEGMNKIGKAVHDKNAKPQTEEQIDISNKEVIERKHEEKKQEAEKENTEAMNKAFELFDNTQKESE